MKAVRTTKLIPDLIKNTTNSLKLVTTLLLLTIVTSWGWQAQAETSNSLNQPKDVIESTVNRIIATVEQYPEESKRKEVLTQIIKPRFDFKEMARRTLGAQWKKISNEEQAEFVEVFSELLSKTYLSHVETVKAGMVDIVDQKVKQKSNVGGFSIAIVHTNVTHKGEIFPLNYKMVEKQEGWLVYDVVIENIGLVSNYRNEFSGIIRKKGFSGLLSSLKEKVN